MIGGMHWRKVMMYSIVVAILLGANYLRLDRDVKPKDNPPPARYGTSNTEFPVLFAAREFVGGQGASRRDLFRRPVASDPVVEVTPPKPQVSPRANPNDVALANAQKLIDKVVLLGILGTDEGPVAVIEFDQQVKNATQGQTVAAGFRVTELTLTYLVVRNDLLGLEKKIVVGE